MYPSKCKKILLSGYYGQGNTGDDCFCSIAGWGAKEFWGAQDLWYLSTRIPHLPFEGRVALTKPQRFKGQNKLELLFRAWTSDLLLYAGGSIFHGREGWEREYVSTLSRIKHLNMGAIGVSLGPYRSKADRERVKSLLERFSLLVLRDSASYEDACSMNLPVQPALGFDLAALLPLIYGREENLSKGCSSPEIGIIPCHYERYGKRNTENETRREKQFLSTLKLLAARKELTLKFFVFNGNPDNGDEDMVDRLIQELGETDCRTVKVPYSPDPGKIWREVNQCDGVLSIRLHGAIFACMAKVPFLLVEYHKKCSDFLNEIRCPKEWRIGDMTEDPEAIAEKILHMCRYPEPYAIDRFLLTQRAMLNFVPESKAAGETFTLIKKEKASEDRRVVGG